MNIDTLKKLHEEATPGEWRHDPNTDHGSPIIFGPDGPVIAFHESNYDSEAWFDYKRQDAELIVFLRNHVPEILDMADRLAHAEKLLAAYFATREQS